MGRHVLTIGYLGDKLHRPSSDTVVVVVTRASSRTRVTLVPTSPTPQQRAVVRIGISTDPAHRTTGRVLVTVTGSGRTYLRTAVSVSTAGLTAVTVPKLPKGTYRLNASLAGSTTVLPSSTALSVRVK
jgi:hypothetical protein